MSLYGSPGVQAAFAYAMTWFLLVGGVRPVGELRRHFPVPAGAPTDADMLAHLTRLPGPLGPRVRLMTLASLGAGGRLPLT